MAQPAPQFDHYDGPDAPVTLVEISVRVVRADGSDRTFDSATNVNCWSDDAADWALRRQADNVARFLGNLRGPV